MNRRYALAAALAAAVAVSGCSAADRDERSGEVPATAALARPPAMLDLPGVEVIGPGPRNAGATPTFEWQPVEGAVAYRLTVLGPEGARWAWSGSTTRIRYGGDVEALGGPQLVPGSWWSVAALDAGDNVLAISDLRPVSPTDEAGPPPSWGAGMAAASAAPSEAISQGGAGGGEGGGEGGTAADLAACELLSADEIIGVLGGTWSEPEAMTYPNGKGSNCDWTSLTDRFGGGVALSVGRAEAYNPEGWGGESDPLLDGLGDEAYLTRGGMDRKVAWRHGELSLILSFDYGTIDFEKFAALARIVEEKLP